MKFFPIQRIWKVVFYTPGIYAEGYIAFAFLFVRMCVRLFVRSLLSLTFVEFASKFLVKVSLSEYISQTTHQKAFIFESWVLERVIFCAFSFGPRFHAPGWGYRSKSGTLLKCVFYKCVLEHT